MRRMATSVRISKPVGHGLARGEVDHAQGGGSEPEKPLSKGRELN